MARGMLADMCTASMADDMKINQLQKPPNDFSKGAAEPSKILPKSAQDIPRILQNFTLGALLGPLGPLLGPLGAKRLSKSKKARKTKFGSHPLASILGGFTGHVSAMLGQVGSKNA